MKRVPKLSEKNGKFPNCMVEAVKFCRHFFIVTFVMVSRDGRAY